MILNLWRIYTLHNFYYYFFFNYLFVENWNLERRASLNFNAMSVLPVLISTLREYPRHFAHCSRFPIGRGMGGGRVWVRDIAYSARLWKKRAVGASRAIIEKAENCQTRRMPMEHAEESNGERDAAESEEPGHHACALLSLSPLYAIRACSETRELTIRAPSAFAVERAASFRAGFATGVRKLEKALSLSLSLSQRILHYRDELFLNSANQYGIAIYIYNLSVAIARISLSIETDRSRRDVGGW